MNGRDGDEKCRAGNFASIFCSSSAGCLEPYEQAMCAPRCASVTQWIAVAWAIAVKLKLIRMKRYPYFGSMDAAIYQIYSIKIKSEYWDLRWIALYVITMIEMSQSVRQSAVMISQDVLMKSVWRMSFSSITHHIARDESNSRYGILQCSKRKKSFLAWTRLWKVFVFIFIHKPRKKKFTKMGMLRWLANELVYHISIICYLEIWTFSWDFGWDFSWNFVWDFS